MLKFINKLFGKTNLNFIKIYFKMESEAINSNQKGLKNNTNNDNFEINHKDRVNLNSLLEYEYIRPDTLQKNISLNKKEEEIFAIIMGVLKKHDKQTTCRVAGGWVRDKLLGRKNDDIDIALDDMSGGVLAKLINDELYPGQEKYGLVSQNCEKSKHLETATMKICESFVDFVNLRSEKYSDNSRVPIVDIGGPQEDASRRDITINSMFYNINTSQVEDFLQQGLEDLSNGYIRTPLDPQITFSDDPLRILRVIRFAVRFQFKLDPKIEEAAKQPSIKNALYKKISNERISKELCLMLEGNKPLCAINLIFKYNLLDAVLKLPLGSNEIEKSMQTDLQESLNYSLLGCYLYENFNKKKDSSVYNYLLKPYGKLEAGSDKEIQKLVYLELLTSPYRNYMIKVGKESVRASVLIIKESLKLPNEYIKETLIIHENLDSFCDYMKKSNFDRLYLGKLLRKVKMSIFPKLCLVAICKEYLDTTKELEDSLIQNIIDKYESLYKYLEKENILYAENLEPLIKGDKLTEILNVKGKEIGVLLDYQIENQIINPEINNQEILELLKKKKEEIELSIGNVSKGKKNKK